jgi:LDH2 family malate/lactate/ureidoglycolate dehydrogenase
MRLSWYAARLKAGVCDPKAKPELVVDAGGLALIDGHDGMGQVLTARAAQEAVRRAEAHGIAAVGIRNSNHFGTALYFTLMAAREGCVAFLSTNASPAMAPWGGRKKIVGTNPWSWACPAGSHAPMVLDIANTGVARGKIYLAKQKGQSIPEGWAINAAGVPTTDPAEAIDGIIVPMAQHKGYAIALMMDMLSGVLTGSGIGAEVAGPYQAERRSRAGQLMIALNIESMQPLTEFNARMEGLIAQIKAVPLAQGFSEVFYPGEIEAFEGSDLLVAALENESVDRIFGVPGEENLDIVESLRNDVHDGWSSTYAGLGPDLRNPTRNYRFCFHLFFRGAPGYRGRLEVRSIP